jgi:hypothetical protein
MASDFRPVNAVFHGASPAGDHYRARLASGNLLEEAIAGGFSPNAGNDLHYFGGTTISNLTFVNLYAGDQAAWDPKDRVQIDNGLGAILSDVGLNNMLAQYFGGTAPTSTMLPSQVLPGAAPPTVYRDTVEGWVTARHAAGQLPGGNLATTVYNFLLPRGVVLVDGLSTDPKGPGVVDSLHGLGGYHGSVRAGNDKVYFAVGVYSEGSNGIVAFDQSWKNVVAIFYHELVEARTDADVEEATSTGSHVLGWYAPKAGEIGDIPIMEAGANINLAMIEIQLTDKSGTEPIQLMWSNNVHGPEGQVAKPEPPAGKGSTKGPGRHRRGH